MLMTALKRDLKSEGFLWRGRKEERNEGKERESYFAMMFFIVKMLTEQSIENCEEP